MGVAAIITSTVAIYGLQSWKRELRGKTNFDIARKLLKSAYLLRDEIRSSRSPMIFADEFPKEYPGALGKVSREEKLEAYSYIYQNRWKPISVALQEFDSFSLEAESIWGAEIRERCKKLRGCAHTLFTAMQTELDFISAGETSRRDEFYENNRKELYAFKKDENPLSIKISESIKELENELRPHMQRS